MRKIWEKITTVSKAGREFDIEFWQAQSANTRFKAAFDMLKYFYEMKGKKINAGTFRLQRSVEALKQA
jgi:hypothetical protein